ncbi:ABC transporter ATP-binding protein [Pyxidicoccus trucidator]|uniref:ABC transporter ATP-binding protein n=1 Tax=Pyxidicoccus trucidator TaxID=2709662 RepID=UPI0013D9A9F8|nr:ABC transporter ATP-binding protein [Pyxidicoccus trucidator]
MDAIEALSLRRTYRVREGFLRRRGREVEAVRGVSFSVRPGELFGLLGPNGAGKTTTLKMLATLLLPTSGTARVQGFDVATQTRQVRERIGFVFGGDLGFYLRLSARDNLRYFAELAGVPPREQSRRIARMLDVVGLSGREHARVETYSRGMRQRLHIARGLLHDPPVVFLDEPSIGVDPVAARELRATIAALKAEGKAVLLTTHYMLEVDALCDRLAIIAQGVLVAEGTPDALKSTLADRKVVELEVGGASPAEVERLRHVPTVTGVYVEERDARQTLHVQTREGEQLIPELLRVLSGTRVVRVSSREPTLEDAYIALVTKSAVPAPGGSA